MPALGLAVIWVAGSLGNVECPDPSELYADVLTKMEIYGRCWFDAMQVAKSRCEDRVTPSAVGHVGLLMYNCFLEKFERRRIDCPSDEVVANCEALKKDIRTEYHRRLYVESRNAFIVFCEQWKMNGRPEVFEDFTGASNTPETVTVYSLVRSSMESFLRLGSVLWRRSQSGLDGLLTRPSVYQLQVRLNHACNHCKSTVSQLLASMEIFISSTWRMWKLFTKIASTDVRFCERDQDETPVNTVGFLSWCYAALFHVSCLLFVTRWTWIRNEPLILQSWVAVLFLEFRLETLLISYALNNCQGDDEPTLEFLNRERDSLRALTFTTSGGFLVCAVLVELRKTLRRGS